MAIDCAARHGKPILSRDSGKADRNEIRHNHAHRNAATTCEAFATHPIGP
jgi:hypothetical protein